jgi:hypothetical protein
MTYEDAIKEVEKEIACESYLHDFFDNEYIEKILNIKDLTSEQLSKILCYYVEALYYVEGIEEQYFDKIIDILQHSDDDCVESVVRAITDNQEISNILLTKIFKKFYFNDNIIAGVALNDNSSNELLHEVAKVATTTYPVENMINNQNVSIELLDEIFNMVDDLGAGFSHKDDIKDKIKRVSINLIS